MICTNLYLTITQYDPSQSLNQPWNGQIVFKILIVPVHMLRNTQPYYIHTLRVEYVTAVNEHCAQHRALCPVWLVARWGVSLRS